MLTEFSQKVIAIIQKVPKGKVATYKQIAALSGKPHASRGVAWILNSSSKKHQLPWQRIINSQGRISFKSGTTNFRLQALRLKSDGVAVDKNGAINMAKFQWKKKPKKIKSKRPIPRMFS